MTRHAEIRGARKESPVGIGYLLGGGAPLDPVGAEFFDTYQVFRDWYQQVTGWTGFTLDELLQASGTPENPWLSYPALRVMRQAALSIGIHDVLAERGVHPMAVGGVSMGGMTGACLAGALSREALVGLLMRWDEVPSGGDAPKEGVALAKIAFGDDELWYYGEQREGVYFGCDFGPSGDGTGHLILLSGYRADLEKLAAEAPEGAVTMTSSKMAIHTPLRQRFADFMAPYIDALPLRDPVLPLASSIDRGTLSTVADVRDAFRRNPVVPVSLVHVYEELAEHGTQLGVSLGPSTPPDWVRYPFTVINVVTPEDVDDALSMIFELGLDVSATDQP